MGEFPCSINIFHLRDIVTKLDLKNLGLIFNSHLGVLQCGPIEVYDPFSITA